MEFKINCYFCRTAMLSSWNKFRKQFHKTSKHWNIFFENTQNLSFAIWVSNERKFHLHFGNINCVFRKYSKTLQYTVTFSKILKIFSSAIWVSIERKLHIHFRNIYCVLRNTQKFHKMYLFRKYSKFEFCNMGVKWTQISHTF